MSAFVAIKTTLSAAMAKRSTLFTRTKKVLGRSRRAARSVPAVDVCGAQSSPWCVATKVFLTISLWHVFYSAAEADAVVDEAPSNITKAILNAVETTPAVVDTTTPVIETIQNAPETIPTLIEAISATTVTVADVNTANEFSRYIVLSQIVVGYPADTGHQLFLLCVVLEAGCGVRLQR
jgi:hypothetical protein